MLNKTENKEGGGGGNANLVASDRLHVDEHVAT